MHRIVINVNNMEQPLVYEIYISGMGNNIPYISSGVLVIAVLFDE
jgi:hypothetical protein